MRLSLEGSETAKAVAKRVRFGAQKVEDPRRAFRKIDKEIDRLIRDNFSNEKGGGRPWAELSERTEDDRWREVGWYAQPPAGGDGLIGHWTGGMLRGLLGHEPDGTKVMTKKVYRRQFNGSGNYGGSKRRVVWFHEGRNAHWYSGPQPARPFWKPLERSKIAKRNMRAFYVTAFQS